MAPQPRRITQSGLIWWSCCPGACCALAVGGIGAAVAERDHRDPVGGRFLDQRIGDAGGQRMDHARAGGALVLRALVALDAAVVAVFGLALLPGELYAVDAVVALVEHGEV